MHFDSFSFTVGTHSSHSSKSRSISCCEGKVTFLFHSSVAAAVNKLASGWIILQLV